MISKMNGEQCDSGIYNSVSFRPRGALARAMYEKQISNIYLDKYDKSKWYTCDSKLLPPSISSKYVQLSEDKETIKFLERSEEKSSWIFTQIWYIIAKAVLSWFMTQTSINGWLQRGSMFVLSLAQFLKLLGSDEDWHRESMIDLGAGDGEVTAHIAPLFDEVYVTEASNTMKSLLLRKRFKLLEIEEWDIDRKYDVISCLNLLDRCDTPLQLLKQIRKALKPDGVVLLALVLPFSAYVEFGSKNHKPAELLPIRGRTFEQQLSSLVSNVLEPSGFEVMTWSRLPYLCEGDLKQSYYWLDDAVLLLKPSQCG